MKATMEMDSRTRIFFQYLIVTWLSMYNACAEQSSGMYTEYGNYLKDHVMERRPGIGIEGCTFACLDHSKCRSINVDLTTHMCELNNASKEDFPEHMTRKHRSLYATDDFKPPLFQPSCAAYLKYDPSLKSGYYWISIRRKKRRVYCDMERFGGGWTLVVTINALNNDHLQRAENNCADSVTCVTLIETDIPGRKLSDEDIHEIVGVDGVFLVEPVSSPLSTTNKNKDAVFYKIPSGSQNFDSSCRKTINICPRVIISFSYPYKWETNPCTSLSQGYRIYGHPISVFDSHDDGECGSFWYPSASSYRRVLYGFPKSGYTGIYNKRQGYLWVK
ncbi:uncharacterized protein LOC116618287 [Nematostella vectensis]|uniref:uncharacterized protein LOC116618287 n=1 Tax=Nematostella vectensis TaxID=45351 RepID=UPI0020772A1A|nr:uncharacterized protein LOC116618287 [Nematostella vectensis]